jgi:hypothetical protein
VWEIAAQRLYIFEDKMNTELLKEWTEETVPALCEHWPEAFESADVDGICMPYCFDDESELRPDSLDSLARVSELVGVVTCAFGFILEDMNGLFERWSYAWALRDGSDAFESEPEYPTEIDARLAAVIEAVAAKVKEKEAHNG